MSNQHLEDNSIKLLILGDSGVGKTCFLMRFSDDKFVTAHLSTIGMDFKIKEIDVDGNTLQLKIWDTAGQERYKTIAKSFYKRAEGVILVYDCTSEKSFNNIRDWIQQLTNHGCNEISKVLVGNKCDMSDKRKISFEQGKEFAETHGMKFFEASAKSAQNVEEAFRLMTKEIITQLMEKEKSMKNKKEDDGRVKIDPKSKGTDLNKQKACCK